MIDLFTFQKEDVDYLAGRSGCLVANEMGTGKTYEAIALDAIHRSEHKDLFHTLVVAPLSVIPSWEQHFHDLTDLDVFMIDPKRRAASWASFQDNWGPSVLLVHWEALRVMPELREVMWLHVVADECHRMKNRKAQQTQALKKIQARYRTAMSGTPVVNRPDELWSVLNWLYPRQFRGFWPFYKQYVDYEIGYPQGYHKVVGPKNVPELTGKIAPFTVRRLKVDVLKDLPDKYYTDYWVNLLPEQAQAYNQMKKDMIAWVGEHQDTPLVAPVVIAQLTRLQQFAVTYATVYDDGMVRMTEPSAKLDALMQILEDNPDEQVVVFSQFKQVIRLLGQRLEAAKIPHVALTGDTPQADRGTLVERFQRGDARVFSGTIAAGGVGITLTAASTVVFLDRSWSPAINQQAEDRLHRIGQTNAVQVVDVMARGTVDLGRRALLELKWSWIRQLLGD